MQTLEQLQQKYKDLSSVKFVSRGDLTVIEIINTGGSAEILLLGAQLISYRGATDNNDVIWRSKETVYKDSTPVRGGIPVIAPWFGDLENNPAEVREHNLDQANAPAHGFARSRLWTIEDISQDTVDGQAQTKLELYLDYSGQEDQWNCAFKIKATYLIGASLTVALEMHNTSIVDMTVSAALHTYFSVSHCSEISIPSFDGLTYHDALKGYAKKSWHGPLSFDREVDVVFIGVGEKQEIIDPAWNRKINLQTQGSESAVVWNPWIEKAARLSMFGDQEYTNMICIETANVLDDVRIIQGGGCHTLTLQISTNSLSS